MALPDNFRCGHPLSWLCHVIYVAGVIYACVVVGTIAWERTTPVNHSPVNAIIKNIINYDQTFTLIMDNCNITMGCCKTYTIGQFYSYMVVDNVCEPYHFNYGNQGVWVVCIFGITFGASFLLLVYYQIGRYISWCHTDCCCKP